MTMFLRERLPKKAIVILGVLPMLEIVVSYIWHSKILQIGTNVI